MKFFFKVLSLSLFALFLPIAVYSVVSNFFKKEVTNFTSKYDFTASAEVPYSGGAEGEGASSGGSCESAASQGCEGGEGGGK